MKEKPVSLRLKYLGIDTYKEAVIYLQKNCHISESEGFEAQTRIRVTLGERSILATLNIIESEILQTDEASLSKFGWQSLQAQEGDLIQLSHSKPLTSLSFVRAKIFGHNFEQDKIQHIIQDITEGYYSDINIATFLTACAGSHLNEDEIRMLTEAMINIGDRLTWGRTRVFDKHCVGGLPGNRTSLIVVPIVTAFGLTMPKTSSRAITSPAGTADTMETLAPVELNLRTMQKVVEKELGCIVWGGGVNLSPADDILIRVERVMDLDSEGQLIASVLSKKIAEGATDIVIDIPVGPTAKVRTFEMGSMLKTLFVKIAASLNIRLNVLITDGNQPVGRGIGPALEAEDVLSILQNQFNAPQDLRERSLKLAGMILESSGQVTSGNGYAVASTLLIEGKAWQKFQAICAAQGGMREPPIAKFTHDITASFRGKVISINNRLIARVAKLAGAPQDKAAGITLHTPLQTAVERDQPLFTIHAESKGKLRYALSLLTEIPPIQVEVGE